MQKILITLLICTTCLRGQPVLAASYSTDATMSLQKDEGTLTVDVRVSRLLKQDGKLVEQLVDAPRILTAPGVPANMYVGPQPGAPDYSTKENVAIEVSWPYPNESGVAFCAVTVKRGNEVVSKSKFQLQIQGPGRSPLTIATRDVEPKSVRVVEEKSQVYLLLEFAQKTTAEVKKLAVENYGNKVRILDSHGGLTEGGLSLGTYHEAGMALRYNSKGEAEQVATLIRGETPR